MPSGKFITFEGGEGTGKTTQSKHLARKLMDRGLHVMNTREPGGSQLAERIRKALLTGIDERFGPFADALLFSVARDDHLTKIVRPALSAGSWIICDRFTDSTRAYQGMLGGVSSEVLVSLEELIVRNTKPDCTIILDMPAEKSLTRVKARNNGKDSDRYDMMDVNYHKQIRDAFIDISKRDPDRCIVVDASGTQAHVANKIWQAVQNKFSLTTA